TLLVALVLMSTFAARPAGAEPPPPDVVRVMSFNLFHGGDAGKQPFEQTMAVIKASRADVVGLQETAGHAPTKDAERPDRAAKLAQQLGWHYLDQGGRTGIVSRFKIVGSTPKKWGARVELPSGRNAYVFNAHFPASPYQPYQLLRIPYGNAPFITTAEEAVDAARKARGAQVERMVAEIKSILPEGLPVFVTGDFNEPSHLDWTAAGVKAGHCPLEVPWPTTKAVEVLGFVDAYRSVHSDPVKQRGLTWTPTTKLTDPKDRHDRIDFVFVGGAKVTVKAVRIVGENPELADVVVDLYPSDHRAVVAEVQLPAEVSASPKGPAK
ncbi:MAG: endonuclease/exonuclease/phosphatase family protein, partial [Phycisphaerae bacterium]